MPWLKVSDNVHTHPRVTGLRDAPGATRGTKFEVLGFTVALMATSAAHLTDGRIDRDTVETQGGPRWRTYVAQMVHAGILTEKKDRMTGATYWQLVDDAEWIHIRAAADVKWERQRKQDRANPQLTAPVRLRDGDECRYCGVIVSWPDHQSARAGTFDHRNPGEPATVSTYVVACKRCNGERQDDPEADQNRPLRNAPAAPFYSAHTAKWLAQRGHRVKASES